MISLYVVSFYSFVECQIELRNSRLLYGRHKGQRVFNKIYFFWKKPLKKTKKSLVLFKKC